MRLKRSIGEIQIYMMCSPKASSCSWVVRIEVLELRDKVVPTQSRNDAKHSSAFFCQCKPSSLTFFEVFRTEIEDTLSIPIRFQSFESKRPKEKPHEFATRGSNVKKTNMAPKKAKPHNIYHHNDRPMPTMVAL